MTDISELHRVMLDFAADTLFAIAFAFAVTVILSCARAFLRAL